MLIPLIFLIPVQRGVGFGEIMFSLSYLPTAERLTVVVVKARSLQFSGDKNSGDPFVKVINFIIVVTSIYICSNTEELL